MNHWVIPCCLDFPIKKKKRKRIYDFLVEAGSWKNKQCLSVCGVFEHIFSEILFWICCSLALKSLSPCCLPPPDSHEDIRPFTSLSFRGSSPSTPPANPSTKVCWPQGTSPCAQAHHRAPMPSRISATLLPLMGIISPYEEHETYLYLAHGNLLVFQFQAQVPFLQFFHITYLPGTHYPTATYACVRHCTTTRHAISKDYHIIQCPLQWDGAVAQPIQEQNYLL